MIPLWLARALPWVVRALHWSLFVAVILWVIALHALALIGASLILPGVSL